MTVKNVHPDPQVPKVRRGRPAKKVTQENKDLLEKKETLVMPERQVSQVHQDLQVRKENPVNVHVPATTFLLVLITSLVAMTITLAFVPMVLLP
jgi:hypothetical protein